MTDSDGVLRTDEIDAFGNPVKKGAGRGPSGNVRNFGAMSIPKLLDAIEDMEKEVPIDQVALNAAEKVWDRYQKERQDKMDLPKQFNIHGEPQNWPK